MEARDKISRNYLTNVFIDIFQIDESPNDEIRRITFVSKKHEFL